MGWIFYILLRFAMPLAASDVAVTLGDVIGTVSDTVTVPIGIQTPEDISGVAFEVRYDPVVVEFLEFKDIIQPFEVFQTQEEGKVSSIFLNPHSKTVLEAGVLTLGSMCFRISPAAENGKMDLIGSKLSVTNGQASVQDILGTIEPGRIVVTDQIMQAQEVKWLSSEQMQVGINLDNTESVSAIQMKIAWSTIMRLDSLTATNRSTSWQVFFQDKDPGSASVLAADLDDSAPILPGDGPVVEMYFTVLDSITPLGAITIDSLLVTDRLGKVVSVATRLGELAQTRYMEGTETDSIIIGTPQDTVLVESEVDTTDFDGVDEQVDTGQDQESDSLDVSDHTNPQAPPQRDPNEMDVRIVEILADPPPGLLGDANGDGVRESRADEFVELLNTGSEIVDLSNWYLGDDDVSLEDMFRFANDVFLHPNERLVVFGGGTPVDIAGAFYVDDGSIGNGLTNNGDGVLLLNALGDTVDSVVFGREGGKDQSIFYWEGEFHLHLDSDGGTPFSPGLATSFVVEQESPEPEVEPDSTASETDSVVDSVSPEDAFPQDVAGDSVVVDQGGQTIENNDLDIESGHGDTSSVSVGDPVFDDQIDVADDVVVDSVQVARRDDLLDKERRVQIVEILADPPPGLEGDVNGDGIRESREDEFVELLNTGDQEVDLGGWRLGDDDVSESSMFLFETSVILAPNQRLCVFGGGVPEGIEGVVFVDDGSIGNGLTNSGDKIVLLNGLGDTIDVVSFGTMGGQNQSLSRERNRWVLHGEGEGHTPFSPNKPRPVVALTYPLPRFLSIFLGDSSVMQAHVRYTDKVDLLIPQSEVYWVASDTSVVQITPHGEFLAKSRGSAQVWFVYNGRQSLQANITVVPAPEDTLASIPNLKGKIMVTEIHASPADGIAGDVNGDGVRGVYADEFVELLNIANEPVDLSGHYLGDDTELSGLFQFPVDTSLGPGEYLTLFGGGVPQNLMGRVFVDDGRIGDGLSNSGDIIRLVSRDKKTTVFEARFLESSKGVSLQSVSNGYFQRHDLLPGKGRMSPGYAQPTLIALHVETDSIASEGDTLSLRALGVFIDGTAEDLSGVMKWATHPPLSFFGNASFSVPKSSQIQIRAAFGKLVSEPFTVRVLLDKTVPNDSSATERQSPTLLTPHAEIEQVIENLVLSEIHPNPAPGLVGDVNGNGVRETYGDEFLEFWNRGVDSLDLSGWFVGDDDKAIGNQYQFPLGSILAPGQRLALFGEKGKLLNVQGTSTGRIGDGLANGGDRIVLSTPDGISSVASWQYEGGFPGVSWVNDGSNRWMRHDSAPGIGLLSPSEEQELIVSIRTEIATQSINVGQQTRLSAIGTTNLGNEIDLSRLVVWKIDTTIVRLKDNLLIGQTVGNFELVPVYGSITGKILQIFVVDTFQAENDPGGNGSLLDESGGVGLPPEEHLDEMNGDHANQAPKFLTVPDSVVLGGLTYSYTPKVIDPDADSLRIGSFVKPNWIAYKDGSFVGWAPEVSELVEPFVVFVTDGQDTTFQTVNISVKSLDDISLQLADAQFYAKLGVDIVLPFATQLELEVDGGWDWNRQGDLLHLKVDSPGLFLLRVAVSDGDGILFRNWEISVVEHPNLVVVGIVLVPQVDLNGDGRIDPFQDQVVLVENQGNEAVDLSGWSIGEAGKRLTKLPEDTVLQVGRQLRLFGLRAKGAEALDVSSNGMIGDGLRSGDVLVLITPSNRDTLIYEEVPQIPEGKMVQKAEGQWSIPLSFESLDQVSSRQQERVLEIETGEEIVEVDSIKTTRITDPSPNPFQSYTQFGFYSNGEEVSLTVYSILGQPIRQLINHSVPSGYHLKMWDGTDDYGRLVGTGIYLFHFRQAQNTYTRRVACLR